MSKFSVKKPLTIFVAVIGIIILGIVSFTEMTPDLLPNINMPYAVVMTSYAGASPETVESVVTKPLEKGIATTEGLKNITSTSNENYSLVMLEFNDDVNMDSTVVDLRDKISMVEGYWPDEVSTPYILKMNPNMMPVMVSTVSMKGEDTKALSLLLEEKVIPALEGTDGVASVSTNGMLEDSISVVLSDKKIKDVNKKITDAVSSQFASGESQLASGKTKIASGEKAINAQIKELNKNLKMLKSSKTQLEKLQDTVTELEDKKSELDLTVTTLSAIDRSIKELENSLKTADPNSEEYKTIVASLAAIDKQLASMGLKRSDVSNSLAQAKAGQKQIDQALNKIDKNLKKGGATRSNLSSKIKEIDNGINSINAALPQLSAQLLSLQSGKKEIASGESELQAAKKSALDKIDMSKTLTKDMISGILTAQNFSMPAGYVTEDGVDYLVRVGDKFKSVSELKNVTIMDMGIDGLKPIKLSDVADVMISDNSDATYAKINGQDGVLLSFSKQSDYSTTDVADNINKKFEQLSKDNPKLEFVPLMDQGDYIHIIVNSVLNNLIVGSILAILILIFFLKDIKPTAIIAVSIPLSVLFAIVLMYFSGITLNVISLSGLAVGVGMLVDNSVVVIENIYRLRSKGYSVIKASVSGAVQVAGAITSSTLTTICVFLPIVFVKGITKQLFTDMALTIGYSLMASLIVALTLVPAMSSKMFKKTKDVKHPFFDKMLNKYKTTINWALDHKLIVIGAAVGTLVLSFVLIGFRGFSFMPEVDSAQISVEMEMPKDAVLEDTIKTSDKAISAIQKIKGVKTVGAMLASGDATGMSGMAGINSNSSNKVSMYVLVDEEANVTGKEVADNIEKLSDSLNCDFTASGSSSMSEATSALGGSGVSLKIYADDLDTLQTTAKSVGSKIKGVEGIDEVDNGVMETTPEIKVTVDKAKAMKYNLTVAQVYEKLSTLLTKQKISTSLTLNGEDYDVVIKNNNQDKINREYVESYKIPYSKSDGSESSVKLEKIAAVDSATSLNAISRDNQKRYITVSATLKDGYNVSLVTNHVKSALKDYDLPGGSSIEYSGENETIMESLGQLVKMMLLAIIIIYLIMVAQFQSLLSPFIVMFTIPLAFTGGALALFIAGMEISVISMVGFVMLAGIIVNNGIVLIDYINQTRADGMKKRDAIIDGGMTRMRPILMTALTTILGLSAMALGIGTGSEMMQPVAIVCVGGLIYATFMTLYVIPVLYDIFNKKDTSVIRDEDLEIIDD